MWHFMTKYDKNRHLNLNDPLRRINDGDEGQSFAVAVKIGKLLTEKYYFIGGLCTLANLYNFTTWKTKTGKGMVKFCDFPKKFAVFFEGMVKKR